MFFLLPDREAEIACFAPKSEVFAVSVSHKSALLEVKLALAVDVAFVHVDAHDLGEEHCMRAEKLCLFYSAFETDRTFLDNWRSDLLCRDGVKIAGGEFIRITTAFYAAEVRFAAHCRCGKIDNEFS